MSCVRSINCLCIGRCSLFCNQFIIYCQQKARHGVSPSYLQILFHASSSSQSIFCIFPSPPQFFIALVSLVVSLIQFGYIRIYHDMPIIFHHFPSWISSIFPSSPSPSPAGSSASAACASWVVAGTTGASGGDEAFEPCREDLLGRFLRCGWWKKSDQPPNLDGWNILKPYKSWDKSWDKPSTGAGFLPSPVFWSFCWRLVLGWPC